ncbi:4-fold beta flower protein [Methylobacterium symbioticum]|uniref:4-fold beta flower domain-containing protein n=1 Tax=Methylobacterium symbioticum TaxID=2584084 RepID=A0A509EBY5_9HYPH|nr:hypothetical protein [Methylobacterium symbioticum]VUD71134.1 hypothetical protein MET9862_01708 [Methylobacterium symbioticum]
MEPLFSPACELVGWIGDDTFIFDLDLETVAFVADGHAWSMRSCVWLGPVDRLTCMDRQGRPVVWSWARAITSRGSPVKPGRPKRPLPPKRPLRPLNPHRPPTPLAPTSGWSRLTFTEWLDEAAVA